MPGNYEEAKGLSLMVAMADLAAAEMAFNALAERCLIVWVCEG